MDFDDLLTEQQDYTSIDLLTAVTERADSIYIKKLALNDWQWANGIGHQNGVYIPAVDRDSGFFPILGVKTRKPGLPEIHETYFEILWPGVSSTATQIARLVNFRSKREETHLTGVPHQQFKDLTPASFLVIAKETSPSLRYSALTVDSSTPGFTYLEDLFSLSPSFHSGIFEPARAQDEFKNKLFSFIGDAISAFHAGNIDIFSGFHSKMPSPKDMAALAWARYAHLNSISKFNPFEMDTPGDALREICKGIEYEIFKEFELRRRSIELISIILGKDAAEISINQVLINIITEFPKIDKILLSAAQTRKSRAGASFENHIEKMLVDGAIPHQVQVVIESKKRPDFILPSFSVYKCLDRSSDDAFVLSAKTTLRERWKQVSGEINNCQLYLATLDDNIASNAIDDMAQQDIVLVVPEELKESKTTVYEKKENVISFKDFFECEIREKRFPIWFK